MAGRASKQKGNRRERQVVALLNELPGVHAERVPLSGAVKGGLYEDDLRVAFRGAVYQGEVKARAGAEGWQTLKKWLGSADLLFLVEDRTEPLIFIPWKTVLRLMRGVLSNGGVRATLDRGAADGAVPQSGHGDGGS